MTAYFHAVPRDDTCAYCNGRKAAAPLPAPVDGVYCISLQEQPQRTQRAIEHFHEIGLCRHVTLYRPLRGVNTDRAIWQSHRAVAQHAVAQGCRAALILEDDADFQQAWDALAPRVAQTIDGLPDDWWGLFLGHLAIQAYFINLNALRTRSTCMHAYIANTPLLTWMAEKEVMAADIPTWKQFGDSIDSAVANLPHMYAMFPMTVLQRFMGDRRVDARLDRTGQPRAWNDVERLRYFFLFRGSLVAQAAAVALSPFHWLTLERFRKATETQFNRDAATIRGSALFDGHYYLSHSPDVAAQELDPLRHFLRYGATEGRNPHPLFHTGYYRARYIDRIPQGMNPLAHFIADGGINGCNPNPDFDSALYLQQNADVRTSGLNPLEHYLRGQQSAIRELPDAVTA